VKAEVLFTPGELAGLELPDRVVVIDVLRATSTMAEALANGARAIVPVATVDDAARMSQNIGRDSVLLCGERKGLPIEGFDLGNAPGDFTPERVAGASLVMTTTNGTRALLAVAERRGGGDKARRTDILAGSFLNLSAVVERLAGDLDGAASGGGGPERGVVLVCAGREGRFALEDAVCAGAILGRLAASGFALEPGDGVLAARALADRHMPDLERMLELTAAGRHLVEVGLGGDLAFCATVDRTDAVPRFRDRKLTLE
jgi:2-phosphosulfolactate phosphatase